ncbi:MAG: Ig-like domain-containing protein, partial [Chloroflexi bacterium]|nr:Ig-like domain-containing protein [Chloroflexota bacterium]
MKPSVRTRTWSRSLIPIVGAAVIASLLLPGLAAAVAPPGPPDPTTSTITGTGPVTADGGATSTITITLKDSASTPVPGVTPTFQATNTNATNAYGACSLSDALGVSTCTLASLTAEVKTLMITFPIVKTDGSVTFVAGAFAKLQLLVPGETAAPGTVSGKTGSPSTQTVGVAFNITVNAVDAN